MRNGGICIGPRVQGKACSKCGSPSERVRVGRDRRGDQEGLEWEKVKGKEPPFLGTSERDRLRRGAPTVAEFTRIVRQVAQDAKGFI